MQVAAWRAQAQSGALYQSRRHGSGQHDRGGYSGTMIDLNFDASKVARTAAETRPKNIALMYIIKHD